MKGQRPIGRIIFSDGCVNGPFLIPPFCDPLEFFSAALELAPSSKKGALSLERIRDIYTAALEQLGEIMRCGERRMLRPTAHCEVQLDGDFFFTPVRPTELMPMAKTVHEAHVHGYTAKKVGAPDFQEIMAAVDRRLHAFSQTDTLHYGTVVKERRTNALAGICPAGIYPDSPNDFSTIHQVSVLPAYRRRWLARAMVCKAIQAA